MNKNRYVGSVVAGALALMLSQGGWVQSVRADDLALYRLFDTSNHGGKGDQKGSEAANQKGGKPDQKAASVDNGKGNQKGMGVANQKGGKPDQKGGKPDQKGGKADQKDHGKKP